MWNQVDNCFVSLTKSQDIWNCILCILSNMFSRWYATSVNTGLSDECNLRFQRCLQPRFHWTSFPLPVVQGYDTHTEYTERCTVSPSHGVHLRKLKGLRNQWFNIDSRQLICLKSRSKRNYRKKTKQARFISLVLCRFRLFYTRYTICWNSFSSEMCRNKGKNIVFRMPTFVLFIR